MSSQTASRTGHQQCCHEPGCGLGLRNNYFEGKRLSVDSFRIEQAYSLHRRRLLNRAIHGWGVVYGFEMSLGQRPKQAGQLIVGPGLALDQCGRELFEAEKTIEVAELIIFDENGNRVDLEGAGSQTRPGKRRTISPSEKDVWLLSVHYAEQKLDPVSVQDLCRCERHEWDHTCETVRYTLRRVQRNQCCEQFDCELICDCGTSPCEQYSDSGNDETTDAPRSGAKRCLCEYLIRLAKEIVPGDECGSWCRLDESCGHVRVDLGSPVPLACVQIVSDDCGRWTFGTVEVCGPRRVVKRNDMLFDLIRGCDLTRIRGISWCKWHREEEPVPFDDFSRFFGDYDSSGQHECVTEFTVEFSRPVRRDTLRSDCFAMTIIATKCEGHWWQTHRVPIVKVLASSSESDRSDCADKATLVVDGAWVKNGLRGGVFLAETRVEIEIRGDFILDCNGQSVDANSVGILSKPTGNGAPGGTFLSTFRVAKAELQSGAARPDSDEPYRGVS